MPRFNQPGQKTQLINILVLRILKQDLFETPQFHHPFEIFTASVKTYPSRNSTGNSTLASNNNSSNNRGLLFVQNSSAKQWKSNKTAAAPRASVVQQIGRNYR